MRGLTHYSGVENTCMNASINWEWRFRPVTSWTLPLFIMVSLPSQDWQENERGWSCIDVKGSDFACFYYFSIRCLYCSYSVVLIFILLLTLYNNQLSTLLLYQYGIISSSKNYLFSPEYSGKILTWLYTRCFKKYVFQKGHIYSTTVVRASWTEVWITCGKRGYNDVCPSGGLQDVLHANSVSFPYKRHSFVFVRRVNLFLLD